MEVVARQPEDLFRVADTADADDKARREKKFTVNIRNMETPVASLWALDVATKNPTRLTEDAAYSVGSFTISDDGRWIGFSGGSTNRTSATSRRRTCMPICTCSTPPAAGSNG
jgi:hypothetical protein